MDTSYELKTKICERTGDEVIAAVVKAETGEREYCLSSHLCKTPCGAPLKSAAPENY